MVRGLGDLNGDGAAEILVGNRELLCYLKTDNRGTFIGRLDPSWSVVVVTDCDRDGTDEVLIRSDTSLAYLETDGSTTLLGRVGPGDAPRSEIRTA